MNETAAAAVPLLTNDAVILGILIAILALVFKTSAMDHPTVKKFYTFVPAVLLCYFIPSLLNTFNIVDPDQSELYFMASRYLLPTSLVLLTVSVDLRRILQLGWKAVIMFLTGSVGIIIGGPIALLVFLVIAPDVVAGDVWRGFTTIAGSWIGGSANQAAMKEVFEVSDNLFSAMLPVDIIVGNIWMAFLLYGAGISARLDKIFGGDTSAIDAVRKSVEDYQASISRIPSLGDVSVVMAVGFGATALGHFGADILSVQIQENFPALMQFSLGSHFFWLIVIATTAGLVLSFTPARQLEGVGASRYGSLFLYILVATIGLNMDVTAILDHPGLFLVGMLWMLIHAALLLAVGKLIKAPFFFIAVGSQANVGGAASAPIVASAFHPALAPVGALLAVAGYILGTYGAYICGHIMRVMMQ